MLQSDQERLRDEVTALAESYGNERSALLPISPALPAATRSGEGRAALRDGSPCATEEAGVA